MKDNHNIYLDYLDEGESNINRDSSHNRKLSENKIRTKNFSTNLIRFKWVQQL